MKRLRSRGGFTLAELAVVMALTALLFIALTTVQRSVGGLQTAALGRIPLAATTAAAGNLMAARIRAATCLAVSPSVVAGVIGRSCAGQSLVDHGGAFDFKFCIDSGKVLRYWQGTGNPPSTCGGPDFFSLSAPLVDVSGSFERLSSPPNSIRPRLRLSVPGLRPAWQEEQSFVDWQPVFTSLAMPLEAP